MTTAAKNPITSTKQMTEVANNLEADIKKAVKIFQTKTSRRDSEEQAEIEIYATTITLVEISAVSNVVESYKQVYGHCVGGFIQALRRDEIHKPCLTIYVQKAH